MSETKHHNPKIVTMKFHKNISEHDLEIKAKKIEQSLQKKHQVKIQLNLIGREKSRPEQAVQWLNELTARFETISKPNREPTPDNLTVVLFPKK
jgi:translation initiation factor IF-3